MTYVTEDKLKKLSWEDLYELLDEKEKALRAASKEQIEFYSPGYSDSYHASISQMNRHNGIKEDIDLIWTEIKNKSKI